MCLNAWLTVYCSNRKLLLASLEDEDTVPTIRKAGSPSGEAEGSSSSEVLPAAHVDKNCWDRSENYSKLGNDIC